MSAHTIEAMRSIRDRRGSSVLPAVWVVGAIFGISVVVGLFRGSISGGNFFAHASRAVSKTFADVFRPAETKPVFEIDLTQNKSVSGSLAESGGTNPEAKPKSISVSAPVILETEQASIMQSLAPRTKNESIAQESASSSTVEIKNNSGATHTSVAQAAAAAPTCDFVSGKIPNHKIIVNEIAWMGTDVSASDEWMELRNNSGADIPLSGIQIKNQDESLKINFNEGDSIPSGGLYLLERTDDASVPYIKADTIYVGALSNGGEWIGVFDKNCGLVDEVNASDGWPGGDNATKKTLERNVFDFEWHTSAQPGGTPRAKNLETIFAAADVSPQPSGGNSEATAPIVPSEPTSSISAAPTSSPQTAGGVFITEVMAGKDGASDYEFVEFWNSGSVAIDLTGWTLKKRSSTGTESTLLTTSRLEGKIIPPHKHFLAANEMGYTGSVTADVLWPKSYTLAYTSNAVALYSSSGEKVDEVSWTEILKDQSYARDPAPGAAFTVEANPNPQNSASN